MYKVYLNGIWYGNFLNYFLAVNAAKRESLKPDVYEVSVKKGRKTLFSKFWGDAYGLQ